MKNKELIILIASNSESEKNYIIFRLNLNERKIRENITKITNKKKEEEEKSSHMSNAFRRRDKLHSDKLKII